jgi:hypothetical protein
MQGYRLEHDQRVDVKIDGRKAVSRHGVGTSSRTTFAIADAREKM